MDKEVRMRPHSRTGESLRWPGLDGGTTAHTGKVENRPEEGKYPLVTNPRQGAVGSQRELRHREVKRVRTLGVVAHTFNPSTWKAEDRSLELESSLVYLATFSIARAKQRNPVLEKKSEKEKKEEVTHLGKT